MFGGLGWMIGGNMAVGVMSSDGLLVRMEPEEVEAALREPHVHVFGREGAKPMTGFVVVEPGRPSRTTPSSSAGSTSAPRAPRRCRRSNPT